MKRLNTSLVPLFSLFKKKQLKGDTFSIDVAKAQHALLTRHLTTIAVISIILSTTLVAILIQYQNPMAPLIWYTIALPIPLGQLVIARRLRKKPANSQETTKPFSHRFLNSAERNAFIYAIIWASVPVVFGNPSQEGVLFTTLIQVSMCTGLGMMIAPVPRIVMQFSTVSLFPLAIVLMANGTLMGTTLSLLTIVLIGAMYCGTMAAYSQLTLITGSETKTRQAEALLRATLEAMPDAFAVYSPSGERVVHNANHDQWDIVQVPPSSGSGEHTFSTFESKWFRHSWFVVPDIGTLSLHSDISTQKEREEALMAAKRTAEIANGARSRFLSRMSHELRTPLNSILGFARLLGQNGSTSSETIQEYADFIEGSGEQLLSMIEDVIDYSKIGEGGAVLNRTDVDIAAIIKKSIEMARKKRGCQEEKSFNIRVQEDVEVLVTDGTVVTRILSALISNAIKFSPGKPDIVITARLLENKWPSIIVRDFGHGMSKSEIVESFSVFYQADEGKGRTHEGTGLGLALSRKLAARINADIKITSEVGRGTAIVLVFQDPMTHAGVSDNRLKA